MADRQRDLELFHSNPPRMFPHVEHQRPKIEGMLAQLAAIDPEKYEERLNVFNELCDKYGVARFARVTVQRDVEVPVKAAETKLAASEDGDVAKTKEAPAKPAKKKEGKKAK